MRLAPFRLAASVRGAAACLALALLAGCDSDSTTQPIPDVPLDSVVVSPATDTLQVGLTRQFNALAYDTLGALVSAPLTWTSSNTSIFTVNTTGLVHAHGEGIANLFVSSGGRSDTAIVYVYPDTGWVLQPGGAGSNLNGVFFLPDGRTGWAVGDGGRILATGDAGGTWNAQTSFTSFNLNGVWFSSASTGWAVGANSTVLEFDGSWARVDSATRIGETLNDIVFVNADTGWVAANNGTIARTFDGGVHWRELKLGTSFAFKSIGTAGTRDGWAVGDGGIAAVTHDQGVTWYLVTTPTVQGLESVSRLGSSSHAIAVGATGTVMRTVTTATPDSLDWELVLPSAGAANQLEGVHAIGSVVYAVGYNAGLGGTILRSDDGGTTWEAQEPRTVNRLNDVYFIDALRGWAVGDGGVIVHTARGGRH